MLETVCYLPKMYNMNRLISITMIFCLTAISSGSIGDTLYPSGYNINCQYIMSSTELAIGDTLKITRILKNDELFNLTGLYLGDNFPEQFELVSHSVTINGGNITYQSGRPLFNHEISGYNYYSWVIDFPGAGDEFDHVISAGDSLVLELQLVCRETGYFVFPLHTAVFYGGSTGFFATSDSLEIDVVIVLDSDYDAPEDLLPKGFISSKAYPNPFNAGVNIDYVLSAPYRKSVRLEIYDITGRKLHSRDYKVTGNRGNIAWYPDKNISSGIFFYRLLTGDINSDGKLMLLK